MGISSSDEYIDPRDVESEADEFESDIEILKEEIEELEDYLECEEDADERVEIEGKLEKKLADLAVLEEEASDILELRDACNDYAGGDSLINEDYFPQYVEELAKDCGDISENSWLYCYIDWDAAAEDCKIDYTTITFQGQDFYVRA